MPVFSLFAPLLCFDSIDKLTYICLLRQYLMSQPNSFLEKYAIAMTVCCHQMAELWKCSVNISARVGSRDICCLEDMDYSTLMKHLSTLSPVCSTNTQSGWRCARISPGVTTFQVSIFYFQAMFGGKIITVSRTSHQGSLVTWFPWNPLSFAFTCRPIPTAFCPCFIIVWKLSIRSTLWCAASIQLRSG